MTSCDSNLSNFDSASQSFQSSITESSETKSLVLTASKNEVNINETIELFVDAHPISLLNDLSYEVTLGKNRVKIDGNKLTALSYGEVRLYAQSGTIRSPLLYINIIDSNELESITIRASKYYLNEDEVADLTYSFRPLDYKRDDVTFTINSGTNHAEIIGNSIKGVKAGGTVNISMQIGSVISNSLEFDIVPDGVEPENFYLSTDSEDNKVVLGKELIITNNISPSNAARNVQYFIDNDNIEIIKNRIIGLKEGTSRIYATIGKYQTDEMTIIVTEKSDNPYEDIDKNEFYANYTPATSYQDSVLRTQCYLLSGSIDEQDQAPTIEKNRPQSGDSFIHNATSYYSSDRLIYNLVDKSNNVVKSIYYGAAYITLADVATYIYAFGDIPANYTENKSSSPARSPWGKYLRLNNTYFSGDTSNYPYEPSLPRNGTGVGDLVYYEIDIGTTGTDCDPKYIAGPYNNGESINRGAARIVYSRYIYKGNRYYEEITDLNDRYVFYTYNHYNDFQEYLNYAGGWGQMFGNITGGGSLSSRENYNPTPYVPSVRQVLQ